ncbi:MAG: dihydroneopterin aldolase [Bacteroidales bacterium]|nr:dihydroneopterin aldolase [Bacteroidales bacterium]
MMADSIELLGMKFFARHGCLESERLEGNEFVVDFRCERDLTAAGVSDRLEDTLDYGKVYAVVAREMEVPSNLLENVAARIADALSREIPEIGHFELSVSKKNPPVGGECEWARICIRR